MCAAVHVSVCFCLYIEDNGGVDATAAATMVVLCFQKHKYAITFTHVRANENEWFLVCISRNMFEFMLLVLSQKFYNATQ